MEETDKQHPPELVARQGHHCYLFTDFLAYRRFIGIVAAKVGIRAGLTVQAITKGRTGISRRFSNR
jgi:hypothetical protein